MKNFLLYCSRQNWMKSAFMAMPGAEKLAKRFMAGETLDDALAAIREVNALKMMASIDHLGEHVTDRKEAMDAVDEYLLALNRIHSEKLDANVSLKLSEMGQDIERKMVVENVERIIARAKELGIFVRVDMESSRYTQETVEIFRELRAKYDNVGLVVQAYLFRTMKDVPELLKMGTQFRLCKGAYDEPPEVAYPEKRDTDEAYKKLTTMLLESGKYHGIATHDEAMIQHTKDEVKRLGLKPEAFEFQMLYGVRRDLQVKLIQEGWRLRVYIPFGKNWYPYFTRRMAERPANLIFIMKSLFKG